MSLPTWPPRVFDALKQVGLDALWSWFQEDFQRFINNEFNTAGDVTHVSVSRGPVVQTPDGTKKYRLGVDNSGNVISTLVT